MLTYQALYDARCRYGKPHYWKPQDLPLTPLEFESGGIPAVIERCLALALCLEIPVGTWIAEATRQELPVDELTLRLLRSNIGDENVHLHAFKRAVEVYPVSDSVLADAEAIAQEWITAPGHPIEKAALTEVGVFVPATLAVLRIFGGQSLSSLAASISKDEQRHVSTNRGVLKDLGYDPFAPSLSLDVFRYHTLAWMLDGLNVPEMALDKDFFIECSTELVKHGYSRELDQLTAGADYVPPFEKENRYQAY
jgi:hypothetical protein